MVLSGFGRFISEAELALRAKTAAYGTEMGNLVAAAEELGVTCQAGSFDFEFLRQARYPLVFLDGPTLGRSFPMRAIVVDQMDGTVKVFDPAQGEIHLPVELFRQAWAIAESFALVLHKVMEEANNKSSPVG
jgi:ABC-type bacteriocin/lantibiotic exporter with double-glycine peptidase domain